MTKQFLLQRRRVLLAYVPMRVGILLFVASLVGAGFVSSQTPKSRSPSPSPGSTLPEFRPALIGTAPNSLINTIDTADLLKKGQKVDAKGNLKNTQVLSEEPPLLGFGDAALSDFGGAKFIPAFRKGQPVECNVKIPVFYKPSA